MYAEQRVAPGTDLWRSWSGPVVHRILPDGCLDLIFDGHELQVAGPDSAARLHRTVRAVAYTGVRLHAGLGPAALGVPADELRDTAVPLADLWGTRRARELTERVATDPGTVLTEWATAARPDPFGVRLRALLAAGRPVAAAAETLGYSTRQLQRRTHRTFGYGPQHLARVLRLQCAVEAADGGVAWVDVASRSGYADQAHLARDIKALTGTTPTQLRHERVRSVQDTEAAADLAWPA